MSDKSDILVIVVSIEKRNPEYSGLCCWSIFVHFSKHMMTIVLLSQFEYHEETLILLLFPSVLIKTYKIAFLITNSSTGPSK